MLIRSAAPDDEDALVELRRALWPEASAAEHRAELRSILAGRPPGVMPLVIFVAVLDQRILGFAEVGLRSHADGCDPARPCGFLEGWYVAPDQRGRGAGRLLIGRAEQWALEQGCREFASDTWLENEASQRAHLALGFELVDRCVNYRKLLAPPG